MPSSTPDRRSASAAGDRDHFIAVRKAELLDALIDHGGIADAARRDAFRQLCRVLAAIYHYEYFAELERLRDDYFYFNPEIEPHARLDADAIERAYADLVQSLTRVLEGANFVEMSHEEIADAHRSRPVVQVTLAAPLDDYREVRFFRRGHHKEPLMIESWLGLRKRATEILLHDDVVLFAAMKSAAEIASRRERQRLERRNLRPGAVLIKYFRNIPSHDLNALFPNVRVVLSLRDKLLLSGPALVGGVPILLKLASTITVLFLAIGVYFGIAASVGEEETAGAMAALSGLLALGGFITRQWLRYQRQSLIHQKELAEHVYFRNVNNNAGVFDSMIATAEDQQCKEAFLAFYFLCTAASAPAQAELEGAIESWLRQAFGVDVAFRVDDALDRLDRLGLLRRDGERLSVLPLDGAIAKLDRIWGDFFQPQGALQ
jgi:hypothetical protein